VKGEVSFGCKKKNCSSNLFCFVHNPQISLFLLSSGYSWIKYLNKNLSLSNSSDIVILLHAIFLHRYSHRSSDNVFISFASRYPRNFTGKVRIYRPSDRATSRQARLRVLYTPAISAILGMVRCQQRSFEGRRAFSGLRITGISFQQRLRLPYFAGSQGFQLRFSASGFRSRSRPDSSGARRDPAYTGEISVIVADLLL